MQAPFRFLAGLALLAAAALPPAAASHPDLPDPGFAFRSFYVTWGGTTNAEFGSFLKEVRPDLVQCGFYGPMFHGYADDPKSTGYPMQLPVAGQAAALAVQRDVNARIHALGLKVVGHFQMVNVIADPAKTNGFLAFYDKGWSGEWLGPRPHPDVRELLMRDAAGAVLSNSHYVVYAGICWNSPYARDMLKRMLKLAVGTGLDGVMVNYNYRWACACPYCQASFREWLGGRFAGPELKDRFGITNLAAHVFPAISGSIPGYAGTNATPLDRAAQEWAASAYKKAFDEIFIAYGRSLKKDLIVATWNHLGDVSVSEERAYLPLDQWGKGENYFWYSGGGYAGTKLAGHTLGDGWMNGLYIRELGRGKPFMLGKYEPVRMRNSVAEGLALGGSGMGLYMNIQDPEGYKGLAALLTFPRRFPFLYEDLESAADIAILWPRADVQAGNRAAAEAFRDAGRALSERQVVLDALADGFADSNRLARYKAVFIPRPAVLSADLQARLEAFARAGGQVMRVDTNTAAGQAAAVKVLSDCGVQAPWTVKASLWKGKGRRVLHLVNYDRDEAKAAGQPKKPAAEYPVPVSNIACRVVLPAGARVRGVRLHRPEAEKVQSLDFQNAGGVVTFVVPEIEVYGVIEVAGRRF